MISRVRCVAWRAGGAWAAFVVHSAGGRWAWGVRARRAPIAAGVRVRRSRAAAPEGRLTSRFLSPWNWVWPKLISSSRRRRSPVRGGGLLRSHSALPCAAWRARCARSLFASSLSTRSSWGASSLECRVSHARRESASSAVGGRSPHTRRWWPASQCVEGRRTA